MAIKSFAIFKNDDAKDNQPQYRMIGKDEHAPRDVKSDTLASIWLAETQDGTKYYSGKMKDPYVTDEGKKYNGYVIIPVEEYERLLKGNPNTGAENIPVIEDEEVAADDVPF